MAEKSSEHIKLWVAIVGVVGAAIAAVIAAWFPYLSHQYDIDAKMIELSVEILRADVAEETKPLREWAIDVIDKRAEYRFNESQRAALLKEPLPLRSDYGFEPGYDYIYRPRPPSSRR